MNNETNPSEDRGETLPAPKDRAQHAGSRLYRGQTHFDFVGRRRIWFTISALIIVLGIAAIGIRGLNLGIDFKGGSSWQVQVSGVSTQTASTAVENAGLSQPVVQILGGRTLEVQANTNDLPPGQRAEVNNKVIAAMAELGHTNQNEVSVSNVGPTWGGEVTSRALWALALFFTAVIIYISFRFEPKMALAAFIAMVHDLLVTIGVYAIFGFQITPDTVVAVLTILGYSLYDTVVVFDRVRDNARSRGGSGRMTYSDMVNLSMNQTLARSINTSLVAILPVLSVLVVGALILGATTLLNYGLALFVGLLSGAYSSIFIAAPVLAMLKEREPDWQVIRQRLGDHGAQDIVRPASVMPAAGNTKSGAPDGLIRPGSAAANGVAERATGGG